jgi:hypothetical protein
MGLRSRIQGSKRHRIPDPDPQHCFLENSATVLLIDKQRTSWSDEILEAAGWYFCLNFVIWLLITRVSEYNWPQCCGSALVSVRIRIWIPSAKPMRIRILVRLCRHKMLNLLILVSFLAPWSGSVFALRIRNQESQISADPDPKHWQTVIKI